MASPELVAELTAYVTSGASSVGGTNAAFIESCLDTAIALVDNLCGTSKGLVPEEVLHRAYIETGSELYQRRSAPQGVSQFASPDGGAAPVRIGRNPLSGAQLILAPFLPGGFA